LARSARLTPLAQRLAVDFDTDPRFDAVRAVQIRLTGFDRDKLIRLGYSVRDLYAQGDPDKARIRHLVDDAFVRDLADAVSGHLGAGLAPRVFLRKLVSDVLYRVSEHPDFEPRKNYRKVQLKASELTEEERNLTMRGQFADSADDVELILP
jgi:hypothetical protein